MSSNFLSGLLLVAGVVFVVLKLVGVLAWPWLVVFLPFIAWGVLAVVSLVIILGVMTLTRRRLNR